MAFDAYSMGFSNRTWDETIRILEAFKIRRLVDIRTLPGSKHTPQFNLEQLKVALPRDGIEYIHMKSLGGLRKPVKDATVNRDVSVLRRILYWAVEESLMLANPLARLRMARERRTRWL